MTGRDTVPEPVPSSAGGVLAASDGVLLIADEDVVRLLPMSTCIMAMADALSAVSRGDALLPLRTVLRLPGSSNAFGVMPAYLGSLGGGERLSAPAVVGAKLITVFPGNEATPFDSHQGAVLLFDTDHGRLRAIIDASSITAIRTAAVSALATRLLAREDAHDLAILGSGVQATTHLEAMLLVRDIRRIRAWSPTSERLRAFVARAEQRFGVSVEACGSARETIEGADIICTATSSRQPVVDSSWVAAGAHINAVGASLPAARELDTATVARARLFVDRRESARNEAGDFLIPRSEGAIGDDHILGEIGEVVLGSVAGRQSKDEVTLFKSLGLAVEDLASARIIYDGAVASGAGTRVALGGFR